MSVLAHNNKIIIAPNGKALQIPEGGNTMEIDIVSSSNLTTILESCGFKFKYQESAIVLIHSGQNHESSGTYTNRFWCAFHNGGSVSKWHVIRKSGMVSPDTISIVDNELTGVLDERYWGIDADGTINGGTMAYGAMVTSGNKLLFIEVKIGNALWGAS